MPKVACINKVFLCGVIGERGCDVRYLASGTAASFFTLVVSEEGTNGKDYQTYVDCQAWGKVAETLGSTFSAGDVVLIEGTLRKRKRTDTGAYEMSVNVLDAKGMYREVNGHGTSQRTTSTTKHTVTASAQAEENDIPF